MELIKSLLGGVSVGVIICYVLDVILIIGAIVLLSLGYFKKGAKNKKSVKKEKSVKKDKQIVAENVERIDEDTYVIPAEEQAVEVEEVEQPIKRDNAVEHFSKQLFDINEPHATEMKTAAVIVNHEVEQPTKKIVKKEEINNYVMIDGVKKSKTAAEAKKSFNRGSKAFDNSTKFLNTIKEISNEEDSKKTTKK